MRNPNGYGSVYKLSGKRRKPYAVRVTVGYEEKDGKYVRKVKYLAYFEKKTDALNYLADYNRGLISNSSLSTDMQNPTFDYVYEQWIRYKESRTKPPSQGTLDNYEVGYNRMKKLHGMVMKAITLSDIQPIFDEYKTKSRTVNAIMLTVLKGMYEYAIRYDIVEKDVTQHIDMQWTSKEEEAHYPFTQHEIDVLWDNLSVPDVDIALILIYTGMRPAELLCMENANIHWEERYMVGGLKTDAGRNRVIPIHERIAPLIKARMNDTTYLIHNNKGNKFGFSTFNGYYWKTMVKALGLKHKPYDCRHTCATLMNKYGVSDYHRKLILGHKVDDITYDVYTHTEPKELVESINKLP